MDDPRTFEEITAEVLEGIRTVLVTLTEEMLTVRLRVNKLEHETVDQQRALEERVTKLEEKEKAGCLRI